METNLRNGHILLLQKQAGKLYPMLVEVKETKVFPVAFLKKMQNEVRFIPVEKHTDKLQNNFANKYQN